MPEINILAVIVAAVASFVASGGWYALLGDTMVTLQRQWRGAEAPEGPEAWKMGAFLGTAVVIAAVTAAVVDLADVSGWAESAGLGLLLWAGYVLTQWTGSILGEGVPVRLAAIHAGDWLLHLLVIAVIVGVWR
jgi:hypothetical protein